MNIPWCTYTDPEIAHVGLNEAEAEAKGVRLQTLVVQMRDIDRALTDGQEEGFLKIHVKRGTDRIVGATIVARHAGELISEITTIIAGKIGLRKIASIVYPYPTLSEAIKRVADEYNRTRLTPLLKRVLSRWLAWTR